MTKTLMIRPEFDTQQFRIYVKDGRNYFDIDIVDDVDFMFCGGDKPDWTMKHPYPEIKKKEKILLGKPYINQYRNRECCRKIANKARELLKDGKRMTARMILEEFRLINGGLDEHDLNAGELSHLLRRHHVPFALTEDNTREFYVD